MGRILASVHRTKLDGPTKCEAPWAGTSLMCSQSQSVGGNYADISAAQVPTQPTRFPGASYFELPFHTISFGLFSTGDTFF